MMDMSTRLRRARQAAGYDTAADAARALGMKPPTYAGHENGSRRFGPEEAALYARRLKVSPEWLLYGTGRGPDGGMHELHVVPEGSEFTPEFNPEETATYGSVTGIRGIPDDAIAQIDVTAGMGGGGRTVTSDGVPGRSGMTFSADNIRDHWRLPPALLGALGLRSSDIIVFPVQGDSMVPTLVEGEYVFVDTRHRWPSPDGIYALGDEFGGIVVKRLEIVSSARDENTMVHVISDNPRHSPRERHIDDIFVIGRVLRKFGAVT